MAFRPLGDRVLIKRKEAEETSKGGILLVNNSNEKPQEGLVVAVGTGARNEKGEIEALTLKVGDRVIFGKWSGDDIKVDDEDFVIMAEKDIMGILS